MDERVVGWLVCALASAAGAMIGHLLSDTSSVRSLANACGVHRFPLHEEAKRGVALDATAEEVHEADDDGFTALDIAIAHGHADCALSLLDKSQEWSSHPLQLKRALVAAVVMRETSVVKALVRAGADVDAVDPRHTPVYVRALKMEAFDIARILASSGARLVAPSFECPLHYHLVARRDLRLASFECWRLRMLRDTFSAHYRARIIVYATLARGSDVAKWLTIKAIEKSYGVELEIEAADRALGEAQRAFENSSKGSE